MINRFFISVTAEQRLTITRSESFNHHISYKPEKAHDGDYENLQYCPKDGAIAGNFLKLYLSQAYSIGDVIMFSRKGDLMNNRMINTEVRVFSTYSGENALTSCGKITGKNLLF